MCQGTSWDCPILNTDIDYHNSNKSIKRSITFIRALKNFNINLNDDTKKEIKKFKKELEIEGGLPFLKARYKIKEQ